MKVIGHRGAKGLAPENTLASFQEALRYNIDAVELDVFLTSDGILVLSHDLTLKDVDGKEYVISSLTFSQLQSIKPDVTRLETVIDYIHRRVPIIIEVKDHSATEATIICIQSYLKQGWVLSDFAFCSFNQLPLLELRRAFPDAVLIINQSWFSYRACNRAREVNTRRLSMRQLWLHKGFLKTMQRKGWQMSTYTMNDPNRVNKWRPYLYAIYTDRPDLFDK